jgi:hypothetical protein
LQSKMLVSIFENDGRVPIHVLIYSKFLYHFHHNSHSC